MPGHAGKALKTRVLATIAGARREDNESQKLEAQGLATSTGDTPRKQRKPNIRDPGVGHDCWGHTGKTAETKRWRPNGWPPAPGTHRECSENQTLEAQWLVTSTGYTLVRQRKPNTRGPRADQKHRGHTGKTAKTKHWRPKGWPRAPGTHREDSENQTLETQGSATIAGDTPGKHGTPSVRGPRGRPAHREMPKTKHLRPKGWPQAPPRTRRENTKNQAS